MNAVWIVVVVVAVVLVIAAVVLSRRRSAGPAPTARPKGEERPGGPAPLGSARTEERPAEVEREPPKPPEAVRTPSPPVPEAEEGKAETAPPTVEPETPPAREAVSAEEAPTVEEPQPQAPIPEAPAEPAEPEKPRLSEEEVRSRLETQLADSERMIEELKEAVAGGGESDETSALAGSVQIIEEGLSEVRALAKRKQWRQAKDKGEALHAQLALMLQMARRGGSSS